MVLYPLLSVCPQGIIYRGFFFARYRELFPSGMALLLASAAVFSFSHIIFRNPWSVLLTFIAGLLFAWRYEATGSLLAGNLEHALYGCYMFTVGLGALFYHGAGRNAVG
jgi:membrane protease YdiL (CAAX protease family)